MLLPNFFLGLLRLFYLYFYQIPLKKLDTKKFPKHIVLEIDYEEKGTYSLKVIFVEDL